MVGSWYAGSSREDDTATQAYRTGTITRDGGAYRVSLGAAQYDGPIGARSGPGVLAPVVGTAQLFFEGGALTEPVLKLATLMWCESMREALVYHRSLPSIEFPRVVRRHLRTSPTARENDLV
jgi:hypothetical protein